MKDGDATDDEPLRVAFVVGQLEIGGTERQLVLLARGLHERGVAVSVYVLFAEHPFGDELRAARVPVTLLALPRWARTGAGRTLGLPIAAWQLFRALRALRADIAHAFLIHSYLITPIAARAARVPVTVAGRRNLGRYKEGRRFTLLAERIVNAHTDVLVANSSAVAEDVLRQEHVDPSRVVVVPNAIDSTVDASRPVPLELPDAARVIVTVANLHPCKGHRHLLEALQLVHRGGLCTTLVLAGDGRERNHLERRARELDLDVRFLGVRRDIPELLAAADLFVLPSLEEGMSNALLEAMAAGLPIIATDVGGNVETIGDAGTIVPPCNAVALASAIEKLLRDPDEAARLGRRAQARSREHTPDAMVERHLDLYHELVEARRSARTVT